MIVLVATLGSEPQVVTLTIDTLMTQNETLDQIIIMHTSPSYEPIQVALETLKNEFKENSLYRKYLQAQFLPITSQGEPVSDITTSHEALAVFRSIFKVLAELKASDHRVHLCAAGGRKAMAMYSMLAAQLLFDENDRLWNLVSKPTLVQERRLHAHPGEAALLRIPVLPWQIGLPQKKQFIETKLTPAEAEVLKLAAHHGLSDKEIALRRSTTPKTVGDQLSSVYGKLREFSGFREDVNIDRRTILREFNPYFEVVDALDADGASGYPEDSG